MDNVALAQTYFAREIADKMYAELILTYLEVKIYSMYSKRLSAIYTLVFIKQHIYIYMCMCKTTLANASNKNIIIIMSCY